MQRGKGAERRRAMSAENVGLSASERPLYSAVGVPVRGTVEKQGELRMPSSRALLRPRGGVPAA